MKLLNGQVHVLEFLAVAVLSYLTYAIGYALPFVAAILLLAWPLLLLHVFGKGLILRFVHMAQNLLNPDKHQAQRPPPASKRRGSARFLWFLPLATMTAGYLTQYRDTTTWFF